MSGSALIVVDMLNTYDHENGDRCAEHARDAVPVMERVLADARDRGEDVIYVNDHYDMWHGEKHALIEHVLDRAPEGLVEPILPQDDDAFLFKARHSIFYETSLAYLLRERELQTLTLVGQVTEQCIFYSALDAHVRHFDVVVPQDAVIAIDDDLADAALRMIERNMHGRVVESAALRA